MRSWWTNYCDTIQQAVYGVQDTIIYIRAWNGVYAHILSLCLCLSHILFIQHFIYYYILYHGMSYPKLFFSRIHFPLTSALGALAA